MTKHRTTHALLVVVAVLLGLNLTLRLSPPEAAGQEFEILADNARLRVIQVSLTGLGPFPIYRLWSDGVIETAIFAPGANCEADGRPWTVVPDESLPLPRGIRVVEIFASAVNTEQGQIIRVLSDGTVQRKKHDFATTCEPVWRGWEDVPEP